MNWNLKCGVIVIGSLYWQDWLDKEGDDERKKWREERLSMSDQIHVNLPIRYGRLSTKNGQSIHTMVFSNSMSRKPGKAYVIPCQMHINNTQELAEEATKLSKAEGMKMLFAKRWSALVYLLNPGKVNRSVQYQIRQVFNKGNKEKFDIHEYKVGLGRNCVKSTFALDINWPRTVDPSEQEILNQFDILLATATNPEGRIYDSKDIANSVKNDTMRRYFFTNLMHGITTAEDKTILNELRKLIENGKT